MRRSHGFYSWVAKKAGTSRQNICNIKRSSRRRLTLELRHRLCQNLGLPESFFDGYTKEEICKEIHMLYMNKKRMTVKPKKERGR